MGVLFSIVHAGTGLRSLGQVAQSLPANPGGFVLAGIAVLDPKARFETVHDDIEFAEVCVIHAEATGAAHFYGFENASASQNFLLQNVSGAITGRLRSRMTRVTSCGTSPFSSFRILSVGILSVNLSSRSVVIPPLVTCIHID